MSYQATEITNNENIIDSRDIQQRVWYLESSEDDGSFTEDPDLWADEITELAKLRELITELPGEANNGYTLVRESYFETYAQQFAEDVGAIGRDAVWPATCIDWKQAAEELQMDYSAIEFDGVTYYYMG